MHNYYISNNIARDDWDALKKKYDIEKVRAKKYVVSHFKYQMTDDKSIEARSHEIQKIDHEIIFEGMNLDE